MVAPNHLFFGTMTVVLIILLASCATGASADELSNDTVIVDDDENHTYVPPANDGYVIANSSILTLTNYTKWSTIGDTNSMSVYASDVDNDGSMELMTGGSTNAATTAELRVWKYASGMLSLKNLTTWRGGVSAVYVSDVDNDGTAEIVTAGNDAASPPHAQLRVWNYTNGRMNLESSAEWNLSPSIGANVLSIYVVDADGDGTVEIITGGYYSPRDIWSQLRIWNHTGGRALNLEASMEWKKYSHALTFSVYASDVDSDGIVEIFTAGFSGVSPDSAQLGVWNYARGTINNEKLVEWAAGSHTNANSVYVSDVDNDSTMEILTGGYINWVNNNRNAELKVWNYISGNLNAERSTQWNQGGMPTVGSVYVSDADGDGKKDILTFGSFSNGTGYYGQLRIWNWNGSIMFLEKSDDWLEASGVDVGAAESLKVADLDGDGTKEIIMAGSVGAWPNRKAFVRVYNIVSEHPTEVPTHKVAYIPVKYADRPEPSFTIADLEQRAKKVTDYYKQQSFGKANIGYNFIGNGNWITLDKTFLDFGSPAFQDYSGWNELREYAINFSGINASEYDAIMVVQPEDVRAFVDREIEKEIIMYQNRTFSTWAHELGHALFKFNDYYLDGSIFGIPLKGGDVGYWDLMGTGDHMNPAAPLMSYNKLSVGWLNQTFIGYGEYPIQLLSEMSFGDNIKMYKKSYFESYIFEGRYPPDGVSTDPEATDLNLELYTNEGIELYLKDIFDKVYAIPHNKIDNAGVTLLPGESYRDDLAQVEFSAKKRDSQLYIDVQPSTIIGRKIISFLGITAEISNSSVFAEALQVNTSEDYDLHVYTYDGRHVGMNYVTGEYDIGIENVTSSGNIPGGGPEWISVPDTTNVYYVIDATPAKQWAEELNVTLKNVTAAWQVVKYDKNATRSASEPATLNVSLEEPTSMGMAAGVDIQPNSLNLKSKGNWIITYIELPIGYDAGKIDISSIRLNYTIQAETNPKYGFVKNPEITDIDGDGLPELMVKFDRYAVQKMIGRAVGNIELVVTGEVKDKNGVPVPFKGSDTVKIVK